jgi:carbamoyl-phosphate synthase small subunit
MPFGHHGANHPVRNVRNGRIEITSQNHGFAVHEESLPEDVEMTHRNLYDGTVEGIENKELRVWSVQYHPESSPGPRDSGYLFDDFVEAVSSGSEA